MFNGVDTSRVILVTTFQQVGLNEAFTVAAVHNKSKSGPGGTDHRWLGVAVSRVAAAGKAVDLTAPVFATGFHESEDGHRWTDGNGLLRLALPRSARLGLTVTPTPGYRVTAAREHRPVA